MLNVNTRFRGSSPSSRNVRQRVAPVLDDIGDMVDL